MKDLTREQKKVFDFVIACKDKHGAPPTVREIGEHFGYKSPNNASQHLSLIEKKGYIRRIAGKSRGIEILVGEEKVVDDSAVSVPLVGTVSAGLPVTAVENMEGYITLDKHLFKGEGLFTLRVSGDSMKDAGILDGDIAVVHQQASVSNGEIAVVMVDGEATVKRYSKRRNRVFLRAENDDYDDILVSADRDLQILGKLRGVIRKC